MKQKLAQFLMGRYGNDDLNRFLFVLEIIIFVISLFKSNVVTLLIFYLVIFLYMYRSLSRNVVARSLENQKFVRIKSKVTHSLKAIKMNVQEKSHKHFVCPKCAQIVRVPKGKGMITIKCPSCHTSFDKKS